VYTVDRAEGRFLFGGQGHGRPLPEARDNVRLRSYRTCDGTAGNVNAGVVDKLLSAVAVGEVANPEPASGGAEVEPLSRALARGPALLRHRRLALTESDVEAIALEASPGVVRARAVGATDRYGRPRPGAVRLVVVPRDGTDQPMPGAGLLATVREAVAAALPAVAARRLTVEGPNYVPVGVALTVLPVDARDAGPVRESVLLALAELMHPLRGGPDGNGWDFGAPVQFSDLARVLEGVRGVDAVTELVITRDAVPAGDTVRVAADQIVCAGALVVRLGQGA
jgi:predicted phage baseplate assembly protein